jgi:GntR family transcriptional regulator
MTRGGDPYRRSTEALADLLEHSEPGTVLPSEPTLAKQIGVSRATLREAMKGFEDRGLIERRQGVGTYVRPKVIDTGLEELVSIETLAAQIGLEVSMADLQIVRRERRQDEPGNDEILEISRVIIADDGPVALLVDVIPADLISTREIEMNFRGSVLDLILERGEPKLDFSMTDINAVAATPGVASRLGLDLGEVLLLLEARLFTREGKVVDRSESYFLPGIFRFHVVRRVGSGLI